MERNTYATSIYIAAQLPDVDAYAGSGEGLTEYTLFSRMTSRIDATTWLGTASGYQAGLYYHVQRRELGSIRAVEWHCGLELGKYYHVYPMLLFRPDYFAPGTSETGTYYHWISFVDPARATPMISEALPTVHRSEARSLKAQLERRAGHRAPVAGQLELRSHTIWIDAPHELVASYLADPAAAAEWGYLLRRDRARCFDAYDRPIEIALRTHDAGAYRVVEHDTRYSESGAILRAPMLVIPAAYAFASAGAPGTIVHRITAWPAEGRRDFGKQSPDDYDTEAVNAKRILEAKAEHLAAYAKGCSYS